MEFIQIKNYWCYQLPEWDNHSQEMIEEELGTLEEVSLEIYTMLPEADKWTIVYKDHLFIIFNDLIHGCELRVYEEELIPIARLLVQYLERELFSQYEDSADLVKKVLDELKDELDEDYDLCN